LPFNSVLGRVVRRLTIRAPVLEILTKDITNRSIANTSDSPAFIATPFNMKLFSSLATLLFLLSAAKTQQTNSPTVAPSASSGGSSFFPTVPNSGGGRGSDKCADNKACAALGITGLCCPTTSSQYLYCCGGVQEKTCEANDRCNEFGLTGSCCPTAGHRKASLNGIYLDCCDTIPDTCVKSSHTNGTASNRTATNQTNRVLADSNKSSCVQLTAVEYQKELTAASSSRSDFFGISTVVWIVSSLGASVSVLG
jgi:hypothetical protein